MPTFADIVSITNAGTADTESAQATLTVSAGAVITQITVQDLTVGHTYAVKLEVPGLKTPQRYLVNSNGAAATNGGKLMPAWEPINVLIPVPAGTTSIKVSTYADTANATCEVGFKWVIGSSNMVTYSDFTATTAAGTSEAKIGSISVPGGITIKRISIASRLGVGLLKNVRLDFQGITTPQKYTTTPMIYDQVGTEVQNLANFGCPAIDVDITVPSNCASIDIYGTSQTANNTVAVGIMWVAN